MAQSPEHRNHQEWLGYVQPIGLVVSTPALLAAQCQINKNIGADHQRFLGILPKDNDETIGEIPCFRSFATEVLGWRDSDLRDVPVDSLSEEYAGLEVVLPEYNETLRPTSVVPAFEPAEGEKPWMVLVKETSPGHSPDEVDESDKRRWHASPHAKFERLLRETEIPIGLLSNGKMIRLVYAPRGETSGYMTFDVEQMATVAGRPIFAAMYMLLCEERLFSLEKKQLLPSILSDSRKYQNSVSTKLAQQVMAALFELLRGFQAANDQRKGDLLRKVLSGNPQHVYHGLLTVLMRTVFVLYAEDRGLLSTDPVYANHYSISGLFDRLRSDVGRFPDTMDQRFGAWAQLLTLFRLIFEGGQHKEFRIPVRKGYLFDPDRYPFLEGRSGDWKFGVGGSGDGEIDDEDSIVSGFESVAVGDGPDGSSVRGNQNVSSGREVRADQSDSSSSELDSSEYRGGSRQRQEGIPAVPANRSGQPDGSRNTSDDRSTSRDSSGTATERPASHNRTTGTNAEQTTTSPQTPNPKSPE